jgi:hypothetical protein
VRCHAPWRLAAGGGGAATHTAFACSPGAISYKELSKSDVIATGLVRILQKNERQDGLDTVIEGIAEIEARRVFKNTTVLASSFRFQFKQTRVEGCLFGEMPPDGSTVKVDLVRLTRGADNLQFFHYE